MVLSKYTDWHNTAEWSVSKQRQSVVQRDVKKQADPLEKPGTVGAFCRTYSVADAIDTFIPDVYKHSAMPGDMTISLPTLRLALFSMRTNSHTATMPPDPAVS